jgi:pimeloyl-ACP methyl ester carboxylesterase
MSRTPPTVVLLHSSASSGRQWQALAERLRPHCDVHAVDLHGHGRQAPWCAERPLTLADEAALVLPIVDAARGPVHLVGHSYGGAVALRVAALRRERVSSVAVYEPVLFGLLAQRDAHGAATREAVELAGRVRGHVQRGELHAAAADFVDYWSGAAAWSGIGAERQAAIAMRMPTVAQHFDALYRDRLYGERLDRMPLLCLTGARTTPAARRIGAVLRALWPAAHHETLDGLGHMGPITHPDVVNARIVRFLMAQRETAPEPAWG